MLREINFTSVGIVPPKVRLIVIDKGQHDKRSHKNQSAINIFKLTAWGTAASRGFMAFIFGIYSSMW